MAKHKHAEAMAQYAEDLLEDVDAWKNWVYKAERADNFYPMIGHPKWLEHTLYQRSCTDKTEYATYIKNYAEVLRSFSVDATSTEYPEDLWEVSRKPGVWEPLRSPPIPGIGIKYRRKCPIKTTHIVLSGTTTIYGLVDPAEASQADFIYYIEIYKGQQEIKVSEVY